MGCTYSAHPVDAYASAGIKGLRAVLIMLIEMMPTHQPEQRPAGSTYPAHRDDAYASSGTKTCGQYLSCSSR